MSQGATYKIPDFPPAGSVLSFPLADGRFGVCRILKVVYSSEVKSAIATVACSDWIGGEPPTLKNSSIRKILRPTLSPYLNFAQIWSVFDPPPPEFKPVGIIPIDGTDPEPERDGFCDWGSFPRTLLRQWRWDHDRENLLADDASAKAAEEKQREETAARRAEILANTALPGILERPTLFPTWENFPPAPAKAAIEQAIRAFIKAVIALPKATKRDITRELRACIKALNTIDNEHDNPIETVEREDLYRLFEEVLSAAKHPDLLEKVDDWRDW
jgi:hypothetical protein